VGEEEEEVGEKKVHKEKKKCNEWFSN